MTTLFLDLSGRNPRVLFTERNRLVAVRTIDDQDDGPGALPALLGGLANLSTRRIDRAHLIVPDREVAVSLHKLPEMPPADAVKVIRRRLETPGDNGDPLLRLTALETRQNQQTYLAEQFSRQALASYLESFGQARIRLRTITTPLQALLAALAPLRQGHAQPQALFNIDGDAVTALFFSPTEILHYSRIVIPTEADETTISVDSGRGQKRKLFTVLNLLHGSYSQYQLDNPRSNMAKVWLCGAEAGIDGLAQSLADAMDVEVAPLNLLPAPVDNGQAFTPLAGLMRVHGDSKRSNFIPDEAARPAWLQPRRIRLAAGAAFAILAAALIVTTESRIIRLKHALQHAGQTLESLEAAAPGADALARRLDFLKHLEASRPPFYDILRELAEQLPDEVLLDRIRYRQSSSGGTLELVIVTADAPAANNEAVFSAITGTLDRSHFLFDYADPVIAAVDDGESRLIQVSVVCTVPPSGGIRR